MRVAAEGTPKSAPATPTTAAGFVKEWAAADKKEAAAARQAEKRRQAIAKAAQKARKTEAAKAAELIKQKMKAVRLARSVVRNICVLAAAQLEESAQEDAWQEVPTHSGTQGDENAWRKYIAEDAAQRAVEKIMLKGTLLM